MEKCKRFVLNHHFVGFPKEEDLKLMEETMPVITDNEFLVEMLFLSVDPYMRPYARRLKEGETMIGTGIGRVIQSENTSFPVGTLVTAPFGWRTHAISKGPGVYILGDFGSHPISYGLGALGITGLTAYFGLLSLCDPKPGETVFVSTAAGAVGSIVGQIAKIQGCRVVGSAGSQEKLDYLKEIGFDDCFNYKNVSSFDEVLKRTCPKGIDCYFDNVGGELFDAAMENMNNKGRVAVCGAISVYNVDGQFPKGPYVHEYIISKELKLQGFLVTSYQSQFAEARAQLKQWLDEGKLRVREHMVKGFENMPKAFLELFQGGNIGKIVVEV